MKANDNRRLLLVDDDEPFRNRLAKALAARGYEVREACDGHQALQACGEQSYAFAVVDLRMDGLSGLELIEALHRLHADVRIIVLTGYGSIPSALNAVRLGASDYLTKPVDADQVDQALQGCRETSTATTVPTLARLEWEHIQRVLHDCDQNVSEAARKLGMDRRTLQRKLAKYPPVD